MKNNIKSFIFGLKRIGLVDVSNDKTWGNVLCVESVFYKGKLATVINHSDKTFETRVREIEQDILNT